MLYFQVPVQTLRSERRTNLNTELVQTKGACQKSYYLKESIRDYVLLLKRT